MATIRTNCPDCGPVDLPPEGVRIKSEAHVYVFQCPVCLKRKEKNMDRRIQVLLESVGVEEMSKPPHPEIQPSGLPPMTEDDLIDFGLLMHLPDGDTFVWNELTG